MLLIFLLVLLFVICLFLVIFLFWFVCDGVVDFDFSIVWYLVYVLGIVVIVVVVVVVFVVYVVLSGKVGCIMECVIYFGFGILGIVMGMVLVYGGL